MLKLIFAFLVFSFSQPLPVLAAFTSKAKCLKAGGEWGSWTKLDGTKNRKSCRIKAKDYGKACHDGKDCSTNLCEYDAEKKAGACYSFTTTSGCHTWMKDGAPQSEGCVD